MTPEEVAAVQKLRSAKLAHGTFLDAARKVVGKLRGARSPLPSETALRRAFRTPLKVRETRGRRRLLTEAQVTRLCVQRRILTERAEGEVSVSHIIRAARVRCSPSTAIRALQRRGIAWRRPRGKIDFTNAHRRARREFARRHGSKGVRFWRSCSFFDMTHWECPSSGDQRRGAARRLVRGVYRTRQEGLQKAFTRLDRQKHRGATARLHAATLHAGGRIFVLKVSGDWNGIAAARVYRRVGRILARLPVSFRTVYCDNERILHCPVAARAARAGGLRLRRLPARSPDLNPCDYFVHRNVGVKVRGKVGKPRAAMRRVRRAAKSLAGAVARRAAGDLRRRLAEVRRARGGHVRGD
jgi:hypothetical protein